MFPRLLSVAVALLVLGCGGDGGGGIIQPDPVDVQGTWSRTSRRQRGAGSHPRAQAHESSGVVSGTGTLVSRPARSP